MSKRSSIYLQRHLLHLQRHLLPRVHRLPLVDLVPRVHCLPRVDRVLRVYRLLTAFCPESVSKRPSIDS